MNSPRRLLAALGSMFIFCCGALAQTPVLRVPTDYPTIQDAINAAPATSRTIVLVLPGTYVENINLMRKAVHLKSEQGPQVTIIDGNQNGPVVSIVSGEFTATIIEGFTIRNGSATQGSVLRGGGIRIENSTPIITGNIITNNVAADGGAGISTVESMPIIQGNVISNNRQAPGFTGGIGGGGMSFVVPGGAAQAINNAIFGNSWATGNGGGVSIFSGGKTKLQNNLITNNTASGQGGGIYVVNQSIPNIYQNIIAGNSASSGGGIYWMGPSGPQAAWIVNNTIAGNFAPEGSAIFADGFDAGTRLINNLVLASPGQNAITCGDVDPGSIPIFLSNNVVAATGFAYSGSCADQTGVNGNISQDPLFRNAAAGDYHVLNGSPAIDSGIVPLIAEFDVAMDLDGVRRPSDGNGDGIPKHDMGVYEVPLFDPVPPTTLFAQTPEPNAAGWNNSGVLVSLTASDPGSGVQSVRYSLSGAQTSGIVISGNPASFTITAEGSTSVQYSAVDNVGNVESTKTSTVLIDKTGPVIAGMPDACTLSPPKHQLVQVATISASDPVSGIASFSVTATSSEPDSGLGGGDVAGDIVISGGTLQLRAEKAPSSKGRTYTILAIATDLAGNATALTTTCNVIK